MFPTVMNLMGIDPSLLKWDTEKTMERRRTWLCYWEWNGVYPDLLKNQVILSKLEFWFLVLNSSEFLPQRH